jgi:DNA topoisomerase-1
MAEKKTKNSKEFFNAESNTTGKQLVIVESPAKARTINKYLGKEYVVMASVGHVRDLPDKNPKGDKNPVPGIDLDDNFKPTYQIIKGKGSTVATLKQAAKKALGIWLATDLDREGEAIAWHLAQVLHIKPEDGKRVVFNAITKRDIEKAFNNPRAIDVDKFNAQQARRILDRIVGYQVSPLLWKKVSAGLSAGRVQSIALRIVVDRECEIADFIPEEYWRLKGYFTTDLDNANTLGKQWRNWLDVSTEDQENRKPSSRTINEKNKWLIKNNCFTGELIEIDGIKFRPKNIKAIMKAAKQAGFIPDKEIKTQHTDPNGKVREIIRLQGHVSAGPQWHVKSIQTKLTVSHPYAPFITSTLQQTAANQLGFTAQSTMRTAQELYEGVSIKGMGSVGLITYMRTDSTHLSTEAIKMARNYIGSHFGSKYLPARANFFSSSDKSAQEAHEAIHPTDAKLTPEMIRSSLGERQYKLYKIIWERFIACQMTDAKWNSTSILISGTTDNVELIFHANGRVLIFDGYYKLLGVPNISGEAILPNMTEMQPVGAIEIDPTQIFTSPPPRYTEASLIKKLESEGIGRPSTYAQILHVIQNRKYIEKSEKKFYATDLGMIVTDKLIEAFPDLMQIGYTRDMEQQLDSIEENHTDWVHMLQDFYGPFHKSLDAAYKNMGHAKGEIQPSPYTCPQCGSPAVYRFGRNGRFLSCSKYPDCKFASPIDRNGKPVSPEQTDIACPKCNAPMLLRKGRFGPFLSCSKYPDCDGILNLDKKGNISPPKIPPLLTDLKCPKCEAPLNLRRSTRGPWLSCSKFPKCRGRMGWSPLDAKTKAKWENALEEHEKSHPQVAIHKTDGTLAGQNYKPQHQKPGQDKK